MGEEAKGSKAHYHPDRAAVYATGMWGEGHAPYPGRSARLPLATGVERRGDGRAEVSRGRVPFRTTAKGRTRGVEPVR
jgi:hypothetical protein